jgi:hypothetical protein
MMIPTELFPAGFHPIATHKTRDFRGTVHPRNRSDYPPKYYFIDFGISRRYHANQLPVKEDIIEGTDKTVPEHAEDAEDACDPFPTDVYYVGNLVRKSFLNVCSSVLELG